MKRTTHAGPDEVSLGLVVGIFGVRGEVRLHLHNRSSGLFEDGMTVQLVAEDGTRREAVVQSRPGAGGRVLGRIPGCKDREDARALIGTELVVAKSALPEPEPDEYYHHQLLGLTVRSESGRELGRISEIHDSGQVHIWVVKGPDEELLLPALAEVFLTVDVAAGTAVVADEALDP